MSLICFKLFVLWNRHLCSRSFGLTTLQWVLILLKVTSVKNFIHMSTIAAEFFIGKTRVVIPCVATTSANGLKQAFHFPNIINSDQLSLNPL